MNTGSLQVPVLVLTYYTSRLPGTVGAGSAVGCDHDNNLKYDVVSCEGIGGLNLTGSRLRDALDRPVHEGASGREYPVQLHGDRPNGAKGIHARTSWRHQKSHHPNILGNRRLRGRLELVQKEEAEERARVRYAPPLVQLAHLRARFILASSIEWAERRPEPSRYQIKQRGFSSRHPEDTITGGRITSRSFWL
jgi:hypothetical protein